MKRKISKAFWDPEKEEKWLNEMVAKGLAMSSYNFLCYTFEDCVPGEYIYRIELLKDRPTRPESVSYIRFMEDNGVEHVDSYLSWVYFRKNAAAGAFEIYSDFDSKIKHYQRISRRWLAVGIFELLLAVTLVVLYLFYTGDGESITIPSFVIILMVAIGALLLKLWRSYAKRIKRLKAEREISEA